MEVRKFKIAVRIGTVDFLKDFQAAFSMLDT